MKISKLLNKINLSIIIFYFAYSTLVFAEDKPIDIWNLEKKQPESILESNIKAESLNDNNSQGNIYNLQTDKTIDPIKLDKQLVSKEINIVGLYDPEKYGLSIDMWSNSNGSKIKSLFEVYFKIFDNINSFNP